MANQRLNKKTILAIRRADTLEINISGGLYWAMLWESNKLCSVQNGKGLAIWLDKSKLIKTVTRHNPGIKIQEVIHETQPN